MTIESDESACVPNHVLWKLQERVKELTAFHQAADILQADGQKASVVLQKLVNLLPSAWQYPEITAARISLGRFTILTPNFESGHSSQRGQFKTTSGREGCIEVCYLEPRPPSDEGPFLKEERSLINSLAQLVQTYFDRRIYRAALKRANQRLERQVRLRTRQLQETNESLKTEIAERRRVERKVRRNKEDLQSLVAELVRTEERERRAIAEDLHDHLGQALAILKMKIHDLHGEAIFYGLEARVDELAELLKKIISYTRNLTAEICPPVLYELGLSPGVEWLADRFLEKYSLRVILKVEGKAVKLPDEILSLLFKAIRELLTNIVKHAHAATATVQLQWNPTDISLRVSDSGQGFAPDPQKKRLIRENCFGLFNLKERIRFLGGKMAVDSKPGQGTVVFVFVPLPGKGKADGV
ncbi:MAG: sensor histidine kinase [Candidatus Ozemobacteraceae bacterium]